MKRLLFALLLPLSLQAYVLTSEDAKNIGMQIWKNEGSQRVDLLVFWSPHESFPSLGIGHFIWYPQSKYGRFTHQFPSLCNYLEKHNVSLPLWLKQSKKIGAPWANREEFLKDKKRTDELRAILKATVGLQTSYMIDRFHEKLPLLIKAAPPHKKCHVARTIKLLMSSAQGIYALVDYMNFKGDGLNSNETVNGKGWGLLQVLLSMPEHLNEENVTKAFMITAVKRMLKLVEGSAPHYSRIKFLLGWINRIHTYSDTKLFEK